MKGDGLTMTKGEFPRETQSCLPWPRETDPKKILIIRLHALGDVALTLPASAGLRALYPSAKIDYLTMEENAPLPGSLPAIDRVLGIPACSNRRDWFTQALHCGGAARRQDYEVVIDLQRNWISRTIRRLALPHAWSEFDRYAPKPAANRVLDAFRAAGFPDLVPARSLAIRDRLRTEAFKLLADYGGGPELPLIVLNPAGLWESRNWPLENYASLVNLWLAHERAQFLIIGTGRIREKASAISGSAGKAVVNLVEKTNTEMAFALLSCASAMITEDSGLMHMAWSLGVPIVALFGSSRHVWSAPTGSRSRSLHSGDLPCGQCMSPRCRFGDVHCLTRYTPAMVFKIAVDLIPATHARAV